MTKIHIKKMAVSFSLLAFAVLVFGSVWMGSRISTALVRGVEGTLVFGVLAWALGSLTFGDEGQKIPEEQIQDKKDAPVDETV